MTVLSVNSFAQGKSDAAPGQNKTDPASAGTESDLSVDEELAALRGTFRKDGRGRRSPGADQSAEARERNRQEIAANHRQSAASARILIDRIEQGRGAVSTDRAALQEAKRIEALSLFGAVAAGDIELRAQARRIARNLQDDATVDEAVKLEVAGEAVHQEYADTESTASDYFSLSLRNTERLFARFPGQSDVWQSIVALVESAPIDRKQEIADRFLLLSLPVNIKRRIRETVEIEKLKGSPFEVSWEDEAGLRVSSSIYLGRPLVFYVWSATAQSGGYSHQLVADGIASGAALVSVNIDANTMRAREAKADLPPADSYYSSILGADGALLQSMPAVEAPAVYVVDAAGNFVGRGHPSELPILLQATN
ncbi:hypothetical protein PXH66_06890 [Synoicihabitans lomoniglobus]|uniref:Uncharacterized protein n=1 Tax=Synoicihabitans lomoniglobus TaxID=2909285 RepID=A0AAF0CR95_9BACT|nr:hypothetical protein PXH66_06890 [Opitutaceae bacterium LMO-M01]